MLKDLIRENAGLYHLGPQGRFELEQFEVTWRKMGMNTGKPNAADPMVSGLGLAIPQSFILQRVAPGAARIRITGAQLHDVLDVSPLGISFAALFNEKSRETILELMDAAFSLPAIVSIPLIARRGPLRRDLKAEVLLLPLWDKSGETRHLMSALVLDRKQSLQGVHFDMVHDVPFRCEALNSPNPDRRSNQPHLRLVK